MRQMSRRGFTLVELLLGLAVLGVVAGTVTAAVRGMSQVAARTTQSLLAERAVLSLQGFLQQELRDAVRGDLTAIAPDRIALKRPVGDAMICGAAGATVVIADSAWTGARQPQPGRDEAWLLTDPVLEVWQESAISDVATDRCPGNNAPALRLSLATPAAGAIITRIMEPVELSAYRSGPADWFGLTPGNRQSSVQPFAGPLVPGATRWLLYADRLETTLQSRGALVTAVITPLAP
jgi:prepilin-type N-terminal cleavage/methylation domain-containing protein